MKHDGETKESEKLKPLDAAISNKHSPDRAPRVHKTTEKLLAARDWQKHRIFHLYFLHYAIVLVTVKK